MDFSESSRAPRGISMIIYGIISRLAHGRIPEKKFGGYIYWSTSYEASEGTFPEIPNEILEGGISRIFPGGISN